MRPIIVWLRRDLRIEDNTSLHQASINGAPVLPLFIFDTELISHLPSDGAVFDFQAEALRELQSSIASYGGKLILRQGKVMEVHKQLIEELQPAALFFNRDYEPYARTRDTRVTKLYESHGIEVKTFKDIVLHEPDEVLTGEGKPYVVFTPFANAWKRLAIPEPLGNPSRFTTPNIPTVEVMDAKALKKPKLIAESAFKGGESKAKKQWEAFLSNRVASYQQGRDMPGIEGTSRMSPYLRFGCISVRRLVNDCLRAQESVTPVPQDAGSGIAKYVDELIWREFYQSVLYHFPRLLESNYRQEFDRLPWKFNEKLFTAWQEGRTGYPLVDAGMRELNRTGWMHNRVRMVVASFLTKDMMHDWKLGANVFEEKLLDIETASNNGGWQWSASTGVDPRPLRIFNPRLQSERFDPDGTYIRKFVPELRSVPDKFIHAPHDMTPVEQAECGVAIGEDYPFPIIDHAKAATEYKAVFARVKRGG